MRGRPFVLSADRSLMSHYRDNMLFGFIACMPAEKVNKHIYEQVFCPSVEFNRETGEAAVAPLGLRMVATAFTKLGVWYVLRRIRDDAKQDAKVYID